MLKDGPTSDFIYSSLDWDLHLRRNLRDIEIEEYLCFRHP